MTNNLGNDMREHNRAGDIMMALTIGLAAGVVGALLLAPTSGRNTRRRIGEMADKVAQETNRVARRAGYVFRGRADEAIDRAEQALADGKQVYQRMTDSLTS